MSTHQILDTLKQLSEEFSSLILTELLLHNDEIEQLSFRGKLQHEVNGLPLVECILQAQDIRVTDAHEDSNFLL